VNQTGSFQILAFIDSNGNGTREDNEVGVSLPLILVQATLHRNLSVTPTPNLNYIRVAPNLANPWTESDVKSGFTTCTVSLDTCPVRLIADVDLLGGGDGSRGVNQVYGGWVQNLSRPGIVAVYQNGHSGPWVFASNVPAALEFDPGAVAPVLINGPLIDSLNPSPGIGGDSSLGSTSTFQDAPVDALDPDPLPVLGKRKRVTYVDATRQGFPAVHPTPENSKLTEIDYNFDFDGFLVLWSSVTGAPNQVTGVPSYTGVLAERTYAAILEQPWSIRATFSVDAQGTGVLQPLVAPRVQSVQLDPAIVHSGPVVPVTSTGAVLTPPTIQKSYAPDYRN
jgi:hypothetical protein